MMRTTRRAFLRGGAAAASAALLPAPAVAQAKPRVVILGGGFAGATCARELQRAEPGFAVTLVDENSTYTACPFSNSVIAGLRDIAAQRFGYQAVRATGVAVVQDRAQAGPAPSRMAARWVRRLRSTCLSTLSSGRNGTPKPGRQPRGFPPS